MNDFIRLHRPPKICRRKLGPISLWDAKSRWLYNKSMERYLRDPERKRNNDMVINALKSGRFGVYEGFSFIESKVSLNE